MWQQGWWWIKIFEIAKMQEGVSPIFFQQSPSDWVGLKKKKKKKKVPAVFCWCYSVTTGWTCCGYDDIVLVTNLDGLTEKWTNCYISVYCIWVYVKKRQLYDKYIAFMYKKAPKRRIHLHACTAHTTRLPHVSGCIQRYCARTLWLTFNRVVHGLVGFFLMAIPLPHIRPQYA